jgi:chemotaxis protein CheD
MNLVVEQMLTVGLGEIKLVVDSTVPLLALGLGSCVAVTLFDPVARIGGMAHVVLPGPLDGSKGDSAKFATVAVPRLLEQVLERGAQRSRLVCKLAGGAEVLATSPGRHNFRIGERNIEAVLAQLDRLGIRPRAADCGGKTGRSMRLTVHDGRVTVKRLGQEWQDL